MDKKVFFGLLGFIGIPGVLFPVALWYLKSPQFQQRFPDNLYQLSILNQKVVLSRTLLMQLVVVLLFYSWLDMFLPLPFAVAGGAAALLALKIAKAKRIDVEVLSESTESLLKRLSQMQTDIGDIRQHIEGLGVHIINTQQELNEKEALRQRLDNEVKKKTEESQFWSTLTEDQKTLVVDSAAEAVSKGSKGTFWIGIIIGFIINLLASIVWALLGNPGKTDILNHLDSVLRYFK